MIKIKQESQLIKWILNKFKRMMENNKNRFILIFKRKKRFNKGKILGWFQIFIIFQSNNSKLSIMNCLVNNLGII